VPLYGRRGVPNAIGCVVHRALDGSKHSNGAAGQSACGSIRLRWYLPFGLPSAEVDVLDACRDCQVRCLFLARNRPHSRCSRGGHTNIYVGACRCLADPGGAAQAAATRARSGRTLGAERQLMHADGTNRRATMHAFILNREFELRHPAGVGRTTKYGCGCAQPFRWLPS
jgi:hypothetical protein